MTKQQSPAKPVERRKSHPLEWIMKAVFFLAACFSILAVVVICLFLFANGIPAMKEIGLFKFLTGTAWRPGNDIYGILPMILGSIYVTAGALLMGVMKKGLEWLVVGVCVSVGNGLGMTSVCGAAMTYMIATELVSLIENLEIFGLNVPLLGKLLDVAQGEKKEE